MRSVLFSGALCLFAVSTTAQEIGKVKYVAGTVTVSRSGATHNASPGDSLSVNDIVRTPRDSGTGVRIVLLDASELTLGSGTELRIVLHNPETQQTTIEMLHGHLRAKVTPVVKQGGIFQVRTPTAVAVALGTVMQVDAVPIETTNASVGTVVSERTVEEVPLSGRDFSNLATLTPGAQIPATSERIRGLADQYILDGATEPASATSLAGPDMDAISSFSLTNVRSGEVIDASPNAAGGFETQSLQSGPYNIRISTRSGTNSYQGHGFYLYGGKQINFFRTPSDGSGSTRAEPKWDYSVTPTYNFRETLGAPSLQLRFPNLQPFSVIPSASGESMPPASEITPANPTGTSIFFDPQTRSYNALTPFASSNPFSATITDRLNPNFSGVTRNSYLNYSRALQEIGGPIPLPRFGEGSDIAPRPSFRELYYGQSNYLRSGQGVAGSQSSPSDGAPVRGQSLGSNLTFDYGPRRDLSFLMPAPRLTNTQNFIADFGGQNFATDFSATVGNSIPLLRRPATLTDIFRLTQPITDPRVSRNEFGMYGPTWVPTGSDGAPLIHINPEPNDTLTLNQFNWNLNPIPSFLTGRATSLVQPSAPPAVNFRAVTNFNFSRGNWDVLQGLHLNTGSQFSSSYTTDTSGDQEASRLSDAVLSRQVQRDFEVQMPRFGEGYRSSRLEERFADSPRRNFLEFNYRTFQFPKNSYRPNSKYSEISPFIFRESGNPPPLEHHGYSNFESPTIPNFPQPKYEGLGYKLADSWCRRYSSYDYGQLRPADYRTLREYYGGIYGYRQRVAPDYAKLTLDDIPAGQVQRVAGRIGIWDYTGVSLTVVIALDHWVAVIGYTPGSKTQFAQAGQMIVVRARQAAEPAVAIFTVNGTVEAYQQASLKNFPGPENLLRSVLDFNGHGTCVATWVVNGVALFGGSMSAISYKLMGVGRSTGDAIRVIVTNNSACAVYFVVTFGTILQPHSLEHKVSALAGFLLGGDLNLNNIKSYQIMINFGGMTVAIIVADAAPAAQHPPELGGPSAEADIDADPEQAAANVGEGVLRSYCLELHKLAPHPEARYEFADARLQDELGPNAAFLQHIFELVQSGALKIPQGHTLDTLIQWTLWASREGMDERKFKDAYRTLVHHNYDAQKKKWDKDAEKFVEDSEKTLWPAVAVALAAK